MEDSDIISWMDQRIAIAKKMRDPNERLVLFLDEVNTCNSMGLFKEIVCDRSMNGKQLPGNMTMPLICPFIANIFEMILFLKTKSR